MNQPVDLDPARVGQLLAPDVARHYCEATIAHLLGLSGGASRETWSFDVVGADGSRRELILRRDPGDTGSAGPEGGRSRK